MDQLLLPMVSIGICTRNRASSIVAAVESLLRNDYPNFELLIIDQSTNTNTAEALDEIRADSRVRYFASSERGVSRARNQLLAQAHGEIVLMTDDDCLAPADWVRQMVAVFGRYPRAGVVFCRVEAVPFDSSLGDTPVMLCDEEREFTTVNASMGFNLMGAGMGMRRSVLQTIRGFDAALGPGGTFCSGEDVDVAIRTILSGNTIIRTNATTIVHDGFRPWQQARTLMIRNFTGVGAMMSKFVRLGNSAVFMLMLHHTWTQLNMSARNLLLHGSPHGIKQLVWLYRAFYHAWRTPIDPTTAMFTVSPKQAEKLAFLLVDA